MEYQLTVLGVVALGFIIYSIILIIWDIILVIQGDEGYGLLYSISIFLLSFAGLGADFVIQLLVFFFELTIYELDFWPKYLFKNGLELILLIVFSLLFLLKRQKQKS